jgi:hypothetical protein
MSVPEFSQKIRVTIIRILIRIFLFKAVCAFARLQGTRRAARITAALQPAPDRRVRTADNELARALKQVEAALFNFFKEPLAPDLAFDPRNRAAHDPAFCHGFRSKHLFDPVIGDLTVQHVHMPF